MQLVVVIAVSAAESAAMAMRTMTSHKLFFSFINLIYYFTIYYLLFIYNFTIYSSFLISHLIFVSLCLCVQN